MLAVNNIEVVYNHVILVLKGVSLTVPEGGIVALLGANGAGKTTTLKAISNLSAAERGEVTKGAIVFDGARGRRAHAQRTGAPRLHPGDGGPPLLRPPDGRGEPVDRRLHPPRRPRRDRRDLDRVYAYFPRLKERRGALAGYTSGGEQQMCAIGRALMARPEDDPARRALDGPGAAAGRGDLRDRRAAQRQRSGVTFLLAEQNTNMALRYAGYGYILENGRVVLDGDGAGAARKRGRQGILSRPRRGRRKSFRDVKHYRRRKRWLA